MSFSAGSSCPAQLQPRAGGPSLTVQSGGPWPEAAAGPLSSSGSNPGPVGSYTGPGRPAPSSKKVSSVLSQWPVEGSNPREREHQMTHRTQQFPHGPENNFSHCCFCTFPPPTQQWLTCAYCVPHTRTHLTHTISLHFRPAHKARHYYYSHPTGEDTWIGT